MKRLDVISNLAYLVVAFLVEPLLVKLSIAALAFASGLYHYTYTRRALTLDRWAMYMVAYSVVHVAQQWPLWVVGVAVVVMYVLALKMRSDRVVPALYGIVIGVKAAWLPLGIFLLALAFGQRGESYTLGSKAYGVWHALWHVTTAIGILMLSAT